MNLDELNKQLFSLQNEFQYQSNNTNNANNANNANSVNFQEMKSPIETTQIKRPTKSGEHRNDINDKMNSMNTFQYLSNDITQNPPNTMPEFTRNYSTAQQPMQQQPMQQQPMQQQPMQQQPNQFASYYTHNFDTLQNNKMNQINQMNQMPFLDENILLDNTNNKNTFSTHSGGLPLINPRNMYSMGNYEELPNKYNNTGGYKKVEEKKMDYRQNMNSKLDNFIFDNPNAIEPNPILQQAQNNQYGQNKDTRMVIQDSNKDYYRQSANDRMSQYSPLSRASNMPISMASMSVNDFYSNLHSGQPIPDKEPNNKDTMNTRIGNYSPLAKTIQYQTQQQIQQQMQQQQMQQPQMQQPQQPQNKWNNKWNPTDINPNLKNVVYKDLPISSNMTKH